MSHGSTNSESARTNRKGHDCVARSGAGTRPTHSGNAKVASMARNEFDDICRAHHLEKIKTIGDSYMAVAGVPVGQKNPALAACLAALEMREIAKHISGPKGWKIRIGVHVGPLVAGVIGRHKFSYDVWGATVNLASRMQSSSEAGQINVSSAVHSRVGPLFQWKARGLQPVKKMDLTEMYFLIGRKSKSERGQALHGSPMESKL
jgi:class 3 adenylate cyclase